MKLDCVMIKQRDEGVEVIVYDKGVNNAITFKTEGNTVTIVCKIKSYRVFPAENADEDDKIILILEDRKESKNKCLSVQDAIKK